MRVGHRTCETVSAKPDREPAAWRLRTRRSSEVNGDDKFLLASVYFLWTGRHRQSGRGLREIGVEPSVSTYK